MLFIISAAHNISLCRYTRSGCLYRDASCDKRAIAPIAFEDAVITPPESFSTDSATPKQVLICQNRTCLKQGSAKVLAAFQNCSVPGVAVVSSSCLGQCGNGPMVIVLPEEVWYSQVQPDEVETVVERHLKDNKPVKGMLYRKFHPQR